ncbi:MAG: nucleotidyl transferase AbiEii/AbiGii toxin family protein [Ardenticatenales bacterium]
MDDTWFDNVLYPLQDEVLARLAAVETGFYLSGGTAAARVYLHHRYSDDLDLFVNDDPLFALWADRIVEALHTTARWAVNVQLREARFVRCVVATPQANLKIEMINDVPGRVGEPWLHAAFGRVDAAENILANKVTALLDRREPKDLADVWGFCCHNGQSLPAAIAGARGKMLGVFIPDVARALASVTADDWARVRWRSPAPPAEQFVRDLQTLAAELLLGEE